MPDQHEKLPSTKEATLQRLATLRHFKVEAVTQLARSLASHKYNNLFARAQRKYKIDKYDANIAYQNYLKNVK